MTTSLLLAAAAAALISPATASPANLDCGTILMPPPGAYQAKPGSWEPDPIILLRDFWSIDRLCRGRGVVAASQLRVEACHFGLTDILPKVSEDVSQAHQVCYFIHEEAHRHGWSGDHPGAVYWRGRP